MIMFELSANSAAGAAFWVGTALVLLGLTADSSEVTLLLVAVGTLSLGMSLFMKGESDTEEMALDADDLPNGKNR